jgi:zinc protease
MAGIERRHSERNTTESAVHAAARVDDFLHGTITPGVEDELALHKRLLPRIGLAEVGALAAAWMPARNRVVLLSGPRKEGLVMPGEPEVAATVEAAAGMRLEPYIDDETQGDLLPRRPRSGAIAARDRVEELGLTVWRLSNGARVLLKPTPFKKDQVLFSAFSPGGTSLVPDEDFIPAASADSLLAECGLGRFSKAQLLKKLAGKSASAAATIAELREGLQGGCRP